MRNEGGRRRRRRRQGGLERVDLRFAALNSYHLGKHDHGR